MIIKALRTLLDVLESKTAAAPSLAVDNFDLGRESAKVSNPMSSPVAPAICFVVDPNEADLKQIGSVLKEAGASMEVMTAAGLPAAFSAHTPSVILMGVPESGVDMATSNLKHIGAAAFGGAVQLIARKGTAQLAALREAPGAHSLRMLATLDSPVSRQALQETVRSEGLARTATGAIAIDLGSALRNQWFEFWYQPKVNLATRKVVGTESLARLRHPSYGILPPASFLIGAKQADLSRLGTEGVKAAFRDWAAFERLGFNLRLAVNIPARTINPDSLLDLIESNEFPAIWPGLIFDVQEKEIRDSGPEIMSELARLQSRNLHLALDNIGMDPSAIAKFTGVQLCELKLSRTLIHNLAADPLRTNICKMLVGLAHQLGAAVVANGVEKKADAETLRAIGCDIAQGDLFAPVAPRAQFVNLLRAHGARPPVPSQA